MLTAAVGDVVTASAKRRQQNQQLLLRALTDRIRCLITRLHAPTVVRTEIEQLETIGIIPCAAALIL